MISKGREQHLDIDPACSIEGDPYARGLVSQYQRQELGSPTIVHADIVRTTGESAPESSVMRLPDLARSAQTCRLRNNR